MVIVQYICMVLDDFPAKHGQDREDLILKIIKEQTQRVTMYWVPLLSEYNGHAATFYVTGDAIKIDGIRINVTARTQQLIADYYNAMLPTAKISDLIWHHAEVRLKPKPRPITSSTKAMIEHSQDVDSQMNQCQAKLISTVGKDWIVDNAYPKKPGKACNYGWHFASGTSFQGIKGGVNSSLLKNPDTGMYWYMIQTRGWAHEPSHVDYSQICRLVDKECDVDGIRMDISDVFKDPELAMLANHDGVLNTLRIPI